MDIYYKNNRGQEISLSSWPYQISDSDFFDYEWDYDSANDPTFGGRVTKMTRKVARYSVTVAIMTSQARAELLELLEADVLALKPGRLYIGEDYLTCYVYGSNKSDFRDPASFAVCKLKIVTGRPMWIREQFYRFDVSMAQVADDAKVYPSLYPWRYASGMKNCRITNTHYASCNFLMRIYGRALNPQIYIGGNLYGFNILLEEQEYLEIDSTAGTIYKVQNSGVRENCFNVRDKSADAFLPIDPGVQSITWSGEFDFEITLYEERSEPRWQ